MNKIKNLGEVFTPNYLVKNILNFVDYKNNILKKHIIDNSCGDGAFLIEIVQRYCEKYIELNKTINGLKEDLEKYIHGIEIDNNNYQSCLQKLNLVVESYKINNVEWNIVYGNTLDIDIFDEKMDFVVGNPPYVRIHNLDDNINRNKFQLLDTGMIDLYIIFFEIGFKMLHKQGKMCLITPNSFLSSLAGKSLRKYIINSKKFCKFIDLEHFQAFKPITTYNCITMFDNHKLQNKIEYYSYDKINMLPVFQRNILYDEFFQHEKFFFCTKNQNKILNEINNIEINKKIEVKNGLATLADNVFIGDFDFESELILDIIKAANGKWKKIIYPYKEGKKINEDELKNNFKNIYEYLYSFKDKLLLRNITNKDDWYLFGRTQAIKDINQTKISINTTIKDLKSIKLAKVKPNQAVYSGLYIMSEFYTFDEIYNVIYTESFLEYIYSLKKYKSGGYFTFSSKELLKYLTYSLGN